MFHTTSLFIQQNTKLGSVIVIFNHLFCAEDPPNPASANVISEQSLKVPVCLLQPLLSQHVQPFWVLCLWAFFQSKISVLILSQSLQGKFTKKSGTWHHRNGMCSTYQGCSLCDCVCVCGVCALFYLLHTKIFILLAKRGHFRWSSQCQRPVSGLRLGLLVGVGTGLRSRSGYWAAGMVRLRVRSWGIYYAN